MLACASKLAVAKEHRQPQLVVLAHSPRLQLVQKLKRSENRRLLVQIRLPFKVRTPAKDLKLGVRLT